MTRGAVVDDVFAVTWRSDPDRVTLVKFVPSPSGHAGWWYLYEGPRDGWYLYERPRDGWAVR